MPGLGRQRRVQADRVGAAEQRRQVARLDGELAPLRRWQERVVADDREAEGARLGGQVAADPTEADDAEHASAYPDERVGDVVVPAPGAHGLAQRYDLPPE